MVKNNLLNLLPKLIKSCFHVLTLVQINLSEAIYSVLNHPSWLENVGAGGGVQGPLYSPEVDP